MVRFTQVSENMQIMKSKLSIWLIDWLILMACQPIQDYFMTNLWRNKLLLTSRLDRYQIQRRKMCIKESSFANKYMCEVIRKNKRFVRD